MINVVLSGRLGNHLFQVAYGLAIARETNLKMKVISNIDINSNRELRELPILKILGKTNTDSPFVNRLFTFATSLPRHLAIRGLHLTDTTGSIDLRSLRGCEKILLNGYFQEESYFKGIECEIRKKFCMDKFTFVNETYRFIKRSESPVAVHIRRGDYLKPGNRRFHVCNKDYFRKAIEFAKDELGVKEFVIFSDDIPWCKEQWRGSEFHFSEPSAEKYSMLSDLALISRCTHQIISNSSYSWWGAWLNNNSEKRVVMPFKWTNDQSIAIESKRMKGSIFLDF